LTLRVALAAVVSDILNGSALFLRVFSPEKGDGPLTGSRRQELT
jgi:hypothetical protein